MTAPLRSQSTVSDIDRGSARRNEKSRRACLALVSIVGLKRGPPVSPVFCRLSCAGRSAPAHRRARMTCSISPCACWSTIAASRSAPDKFGRPAKSASSLFTWSGNSSRRPLSDHCPAASKNVNLKAARHRRGLMPYCKPSAPAEVVDRANSGMPCSSSRARRSFFLPILGIPDHFPATEGRSSRIRWRSVRPSMASSRFALRAMIFLRGSRTAERIMRWRPGVVGQGFSTMLRTMAAKGAQLARGEAGPSSGSKFPPFPPRSDVCEAWTVLRCNLKRR